MLTLKTEQLYDLSHTLASELLRDCEYPWLALPHIKGFILSLGATLPQDRYEHPAEDIWIARSAKVAPSATLCGPLIVGEDTEIRTGAYIRGSVLIGCGCVVGNSCELKNAILFDNVQVPHFNYILTMEAGEEYKKHSRIMKAAATRLRAHMETAPAWANGNSSKAIFTLKQQLWDGQAYTDKQEVNSNSNATVKVIFGSGKEADKAFD